MPEIKTLKAYKIMANKLFAIFLVCVSIAAALHIQNVEAHEDSTKGRFVECFKECENECLSKGHGYTLCEMKCDTDCADKEADGTYIN